MANYFTTRHSNASKKEELYRALAAILSEEEAAHDDYLRSVREVITHHPNLTAQQYANMLSNDAEERKSIKISIGMMGAMAEDARDKNSHICDTPSIPNLRRKVKTITRRFVEIDTNGNPLGTVEYQEHKFTYHMD